MPGLLDLPLELRLKIFSYYQNYRGPYWRVIGNHPAVSLVNRQLRHESLDVFYRRYRWCLPISISKGGNMASMDSSIIKHLQAMQRAKQLWRVQVVRFMYTFPKVTVFSVMDVDPTTHPFDAHNPNRTSFYDTLCSILWGATNLKSIELAWTGLSHKVLEGLCSPACVRPLAKMPKTCEYRIRQHEVNWGSVEDSGSAEVLSPSLKKFANHIQEKTGKAVEVIHKSFI